MRVSVLVHYVLQVPDLIECVCVRVCVRESVYVCVCAGVSCALDTLFCCVLCV